MNRPKLIVIAVGGNSLIEDPSRITVESQFEAARKTAAHIARLAAAGHRIIVVHGNGPQVGFILQRAEYARKILHPVPLDCCVADTQGAIGYNLQMGLYTEFKKLGMRFPVASVVTQVKVDPEDPSFSNPLKPIGSFMTVEEAQLHRERDGWSVAEDAGRGYRRVVPSPRPLEILELESIRSLSDAGTLVIAAGGGGIPVVEDDAGLHPREAVVDKDYAAALLAKQLEADVMIISTAVDQVYLQYGKPDQQALEEVTTTDLRTYAAAGHFAPGSMLPKIEALIDFTEQTGHPGIITSPPNLTAAVAGTAGTRVITHQSPRASH